MSDWPIMLKWAGGKRNLVPRILERLPQGQFKQDYIEPFVGGGALFFALQSMDRLQSGKAFLNDSNPELIAAYKGVRDCVRDVIVALREFKFEEDFYYKLRAQNPEEMALSDRAARMIYLNKTSFNGLYRVNSKGQFNVPIGRYKNPNFCDEETLLRASEALSNVRLLCDDFEAVMNEAKEGDVMYCDPPYVPLDKGSFTKFGKLDFKENDQVRLRDTARRCKARGVHIVLSNSGAPVVRDLYGEGFTIETVLAQRAVNSKGEGRGLVQEVLIT